jgi:tetratricopeptide (TPR) repeat protein
MAKKIITENKTDSRPEEAAETQPVKRTRPIFKSENTENNPETQPVKKATPVENKTDSIISEPPNKSRETKKKGHASWIWIGILGMIIITAIGTGIGYKMALDLRQHEELNQRLVVATTQFELALNDEKSGNLDLARQRLEYILEIYPAYPGLDAKLKDVMLAIALTQGPSQLTTPVPNESPTTAATIVATVDTKNLSKLLNQAQAQLAGKDWTGLLATVLNMRNLDPFYEAVKVDGLYYMALRNNGIAKVKEGSLETGIYYFSLAEQMAPIDSDAASYRIWARLYDNAGSYWRINMQQAASLYSELYSLVPNLIDSSGITVRTRYAGALEGYGDYLQQTYMWCDAVTQYEASMGIISSEALSAKLTQAREYCSNPPSTPTPTVDPSIPTPTTPPG